AGIRRSHVTGVQTCALPISGWDCHGLPIEHKVEQKVGKVGHKVDARTFREECRRYAASQVDGQRKEFIRLGVFGDWDNPYLTMRSEERRVRNGCRSAPRAAP